MNMILNQKNRGPESPLLCRKDAARYLGVATQTLAKWACSGCQQLPITKIGRKAMYAKTALDSYIQARTQNFGQGSINGGQHA